MDLGKTYMVSNKSDTQTKAFENYQADYSGTVYDNPVAASADMTGYPMTPLALAMQEYQNDAPAPTAQLRQGLLGAGMDMAQGQMFKGVGEVLGMAGYTEAEAKLLEWSEQNVNDSMVDRDGLIDDVVFTAGQIAMPIGVGLTAAAAAPLIGASAVVGSGLAGFVTAWGMTAGDFFMKEQELDEDYEPNVTDLGITGLLALPEAVAVTKGSKLLKPFAEAVAGTAAKTAAATGGKMAAKNASRFGEYGKGFAKNALEQGALEASQDFAGSVAAHIRTDTELDDQRLASIGKAAAYEGLIGGIFGGPLGVGTTYKSRVARKQAEQDAVARETFTALQGEEGELSSEYERLIPVTGAPKQPGFLNLGTVALVGNATDKFRNRFGHLGKVANILDNFNVKSGARKKGQFTINEKARGLEAEFHTLAMDFNKSTETQRVEAWNAVAEGEVLDTPAYKSLTKLLHAAIPEATGKASRGKVDINEGWLADNTYLPTMVTMDFKAMAERPWKDIKAEAKADLEARGAKNVSQQLGALKQAINSYKATGDHLSYAKMAKDHKYMDNILDRMDKYANDGKGMTAKRRKALKGSIKNTNKGQNRQSPVTLDRMLGDYSQSFLNKYRKKEDPRGALNAHIRMVSEHLAMMDTFGVDNVLFDEAVIDAVADSYKFAKQEGDTTLAMNAMDVETLYDILRTQQRIHLKPLISQKKRDIQNKTRAVANTMLLGLSTLVSIPEALVIFMNTGGKASLKGLGQTIAQIGKGREKRIGLASEQLGYTIRTAIDHAINRTGEEAFEVSKWENQFIRWTGLPYLQHFLTVWAARANDVHIKEMAVQIEKETNLEKRAYMTAKVEEAGLDVDKLLDWKASGFNEDSEFFTKTYIPAVVGLTQDTIVDPHPIDKPLWMNDERLLLLTQLKGFMTVFTNRVMRKWAVKVRNTPEGNVQLATKVAPYVAMYLAAQVGMQAVREVMKKGDLDDWDDKTMEDRVWSAFGYLGGMGYFVDVYNSLKFRSDPLASVAGPVPAKALNSAGHLVNAIEQQDPEAFLENMVKELFPNMPGKDLILEAFGAE